METLCDLREREAERIIALSGSKPLAGCWGRGRPSRRLASHGGTHFPTQTSDSARAGTSRLVRAAGRSHVVVIPRSQLPHRRRSAGRLRSAHAVPRLGLAPRCRRPTRSRVLRPAEAAGAGRSYGGHARGRKMWPRPSQTRPRPGGWWQLTARPPGRPGGERLRLRVCRRSPMRRRWDHGHTRQQLGAATGGRRVEALYRRRRERLARVAAGC